MGHTESVEGRNGARSSPGLRGPWRVLADPRLAGLLAAVFGAVLIGRALWENRPPEGLADATARTEGTVTFFGVTKKPDTSVVRVDFVYHVGGKTLDGFARAEVAPERVGDVPQYKPGDPLTVRYVPEDPERCIVDEFHGRVPPYQDPNFVVGVGLVALGLAYGLGRKPASPSASGGREPPVLVR